AQLVAVAAFDGVHHLARLLDHVPAERGEGLLPIPGAPVRREEPLHQLDEAGKGGALLLSERRRGDGIEGARHGAGRLAQARGGARENAALARLAAPRAPHYESWMPADAEVHPIARLPGEWSVAMAALGERAYAAKQVFDWIQRRGVVDAAAMTNLPARLRAALAERGLAPGVVVPEQVHRSTDGTRKIAVRLRDGALVETVLLPAVSGPGSSVSSVDADAAAGDDEEDDGEPAAEAPRVRVTQCISTQVG